MEGKRDTKCKVHGMGLGLGGHSGFPPLAARPAELHGPPVSRVCASGGEGGPSGGRSRAAVPRHEDLGQRSRPAGAGSRRLQSDPSWSHHARAFTSPVPGGTLQKASAMRLHMKCLPRQDEPGTGRHFI